LDWNDNRLFKGHTAKHRNDVFRLLLTVAPADMIGLVPAVQDDLRLCIIQLPPYSPTWGSIRNALKSNKLTLPPIEEAIQLFKTLHGFRRQANTSRFLA
jgi:hypothetical protein